MQDDEGGERVWVPTIPVGRDRAGFVPHPPPVGGVGGPTTLVLRKCLICDDDDGADVMQVSPKDPAAVKT